MQNTDIQNEDHFTARITLLYCLNGFAQETASVTEKTETVETFDTFYDTIKSKKRVILKEIIITAKIHHPNKSHRSETSREK